MATQLVQQGYYALVRWRPDVTRDEAKNVAVILVDPEGQFGGVKSAPISEISQSLRDQGLIDALVNGLKGQFSSQAKPDLGWLRALHSSLFDSLVVTEPAPTAVPAADETLEALYRALVAPRYRGSSPRTVTKGAFLDRVVERFRTEGIPVRRGEYVKDFLFDAVATPKGRPPIMVEVLSFATLAKSWVNSEHDAGHFLYAVERTNASTAMAVINPPTDESVETARASFERIKRWFNVAQLFTITSDELGRGRLPLPGQTRQ